MAGFPASSSNLSAHGSVSPVASSPAVTASASLTQSGDQVASCNACVIMVGWDGLFRAYWYNSSIDITLDTVSVVVTKYNNTAVTKSSTVYGDIDPVNVSTVSEAQSIATSLGTAIADMGDLDYGNFVDVLLGNATKGNVDASDPPAYPTSYLGFDTIYYISTSSSFDGCPLGKRGSSYTCSCPMESVIEDYAMSWVHEIGGIELHSVSLTSTLYQPLDVSPAFDFIGKISKNFGALNTESFWDLLSSASVFKSHPELSSCAVFNGFVGPPRVIIPVFALTATVATTITGLGTYSPPIPQPGSPNIPTPIAPQTAESLPKVQTGQAATVTVPNPAAATPAPAPSPPEAAPSSSNTPASHGGSAAGGSVPNPAAAAPAPAPSFPEAAPSPSSMPASHVGSAAGGSPAEAGRQPPFEGLHPVLTFGGSTYTADESSNIVLSGQTLVAGSPAATIANTPISIAPGGLAAVVGTSTQLLASLPSPAVLTFGGSAYTADASSNIILAGSTLKPGGTPVIASGITVSLVPGGAAALVGTHTQVLGGLTPAQGSSNTAQKVPNPVPAAPVLTFEGSTYTADAASQFVVAGQTVVPGGVIDISGTPISIAPDATVAVIGSSTQSLVGSAITPQPVLTFAGSTYTAGTSSEFLINGQTLTKSGTVNVDGTQLSFGRDGTYVVIGTSTQQLLTPGVTAIVEPILTFDGFVYTAGPSSDFVIDSQTLSRGGAIDVNGTRLSYGQGGTEVIVGTSTQRLGFASITVAEEPAITFDGSTYYADSASYFVIDGQTLTRVSGSDVVIGTSTEAVGLGGYIMNGFGSGSSTTLPVIFTGKAARKIPAAELFNLICIEMASAFYVVV